MIGRKVEDQDLSLQSWSEDDLSGVRDFKVVCFLKTLFMHLQENSRDIHKHTKIKKSRGITPHPPITHVLHPKSSTVSHLSCLLSEKYTCALMSTVRLGNKLKPQNICKSLSDKGLAVDLS